MTVSCSGRNAIEFMHLKDTTMSNDFAAQYRITAARLVWWGFLAGIGFTLGSELVGAPFRLAYTFLRMQAGLGSD